MKNSILDDIINRNGEFMEIVEPNEKYKQLYGEAIKCYDKLKETLNKDEIDCFDYFVDTHTEANSEFVKLSFKTGFKLCLKLVVECLCDGDI